MNEKRAVTKETKKRYSRATKKDKTKMLDEFTALTGYDRNYAARVLRAGMGNFQPAKTGKRRPAKRMRPKVYTDDLMPPLKRIWAVSDMICGKRLAPILPGLLSKLEEFHEITVDGPVREKLIGMSASTIDRLLATEKRKFAVKGRHSTKPGTLLKHQIPIRTFSDWDEGKVGFVEIDLVGHDGGNPKGDYCQTLDVTDIMTGWTETRAVKNKARVWVFAALQDIIERLPFPVLGVDSDNGGEFINNHLISFCETENITFTRSRAYKKNDACFVEQKNWSVVRRNVGYLRYDTERELDLLNELYGSLRLFTNFFSPSMKLIEKQRDGAKVTKRYDRAKTPYRRVMDSADVSASIKERLTAEYATLNPARLRRDISRLQNKLIDIGIAKNDTRRNMPADGQGLEYILDEATNGAFEYILT